MWCSRFMNFRAVVEDRRRGILIVIRHAVTAFVLVSWYLIALPSSRNDYEQLAPKAPLSDWIALDTFNTLKQCENNIKLAVTDGNADFADFGLSQCIASNDPRLKEN
jgi:hypothetical protein